MRSKDISTAIQGHLWVVENINNPNKCIESIFALEDLRTQISNDKRLNTGPLMVEINRVMDSIQRRMVVEYEVELHENRCETQVSVTTICAAASAWLLGLSVVGMYAYGLSSLLLS
jgi:hypothetical protein